MREAKKHWFRWQSEGVNWRMKGYAQLQMPICNAVGYPKFANAKKNVTCKNCQRILRGYTNE